jgi:hypothetical protein
MPTPNISEAVVMTLNNLKSKFYDNMSNNMELLKRLRKNGNMSKSMDGGRAIQLDLEYAENGTVKRYSGYEALDISPSEVFSAVTFPWRQMAAAVSMSGLESLINSGDSARYNQWAKRIDNAMKSMMNVMSSDIYSDGTADGGKQVGGLQLLVPDVNTNTVGGIDANAWSFWRNQVYDFSNLSLTPSTATIQNAMNLLSLATSRGADKTDLIVADNTFYNFYWSSLQAIQRITSSGDGAAGYSNLKFMGSDVVCDGGIWGSAPPGMYFLNTKYLYFFTHPKRDFAPMEKRGSVNQDAETQLILWAGNMAVSNRLLQGRMVL